VISCSSCGADLGIRPPWICEPCDREYIGPQPGPQTDFLACSSTIALYGGAAGGGKSHMLLYLALLGATSTPGWNGIICREQSNRVSLGGGLWDEAEAMFSGTGGEPRAGSYMDWRWPHPGGRDSVLSFKHLSKFNYKGYRGPGFDFIGLDEVTEMPWSAVVFMLSRLRSPRGGRPLFRMTTNPDPGHPLADLLGPYLLPSGDPDRSQSGRVRWLLRGKGRDWLGDTPQEAATLAGGDPAHALSFAFIPSLLEDNPALDLADPGYRARLANMDPELAAQLIRGNWRERKSTGGPFERIRWEKVSAPISPIVQWFRPWDKAASKPSTDYPDPDYTVGPLVGFDAAGRFYLAGLAACREDTPIRDQMIANTAACDGHMVTQIHKQAPGDTGKSDVYHMRSLLRLGGADTEAVLESKNKVIRGQPMGLALRLGMLDGKIAHREARPGEEWSARGYILDQTGWLQQPYTDAGSHPRTLGDLVFSQLDPFPNGEHDDILDAMFDAFAVWSKPRADRAAQAGRRAAAYVR
jgi:phage terminase large subunit-like protein